MLVLVICAIALALGLAILGIVGFVLWGHATRLMTTVDATVRDLQPKLDRIQPPNGNGRHRAD